jgi:PHP family Zn ribbon phosphoesterase
MIPPLIIERALEKEINLIAITDHNSIENIPAVIEAAQGTNITVLAGMELQTREEVHSLCLFNTFEACTSFYQDIFDSFPKIKNNSDFFGEQFVVDSTGDFVSREERLLITSSSLSLKSAFEKVDHYGGLLIPAHVNRTAYGLIQVLGFIPTDIQIEVCEISRHLSLIQAVNQFPELTNYCLIQGGDAHMLEEIQGWNLFSIESPDIKEIRLALKGQAGRHYRNLRNM